MSDDRLADFGAYRKALQLFDLVVEDTNISWGDTDRGAAGAVADYMAAHPGELAADILCERYLLTMHPGGWLRRVRGCSHG